MSRYNQYDLKAKELLDRACVNAALAGRQECQIRDLLICLFGEAPATSPASVPPGQKMRLSDSLRQILDRAEQISCAEVGALELFRSIAAVSKEELARYLAGERAGVAVDVLPQPREIEESLSAEILGQDDAIRLVAETIRVRSSGLALSPHRPAGVFLFTGPTGVGKTEMALVLSRVVTGRPDRLLRIDCSEYSEAHQVSRLLGAPPSYIGHGTPSPLDEFLKEHRDGVVLLDEFEKAHPAFHRLMLQAFDAGRLTDSRGRVLNCSGLVFVATANIVAACRPAVGFRESSGAPPEPDAPVGELLRVLPIEVINRFDEIIPFRPLDRCTAKRILQKRLLVSLNERAQLKGVHSVVLSESAEELVLAAGYSHQFGARHLNRAFSRLVIAPVSRFLAANDAPGPVIIVDAHGTTCRVAADVMSGAMASN